MGIDSLTEKLCQTPLQPLPVITPFLATSRALALASVAGMSGAVAMPAKLALKMGRILLVSHSGSLALAFNQSRSVLRIPKCR
jgi:hypothetical protein